MPASTTISTCVATEIKGVGRIANSAAGNANRAEDTVGLLGTDAVTRVSQRHAARAIAVLGATWAAGVMGVVRSPGPAQHDGLPIVGFGAVERAQRLAWAQQGMPHEAIGTGSRWGMTQTA